MIPKYLDLTCYLPPMQKSSKIVEISDLYRNFGIWNIWNLLGDNWVLKWSPLAEGPFFNGTLVPKIQLAILTTSKNTSVTWEEEERGICFSRERLAAPCGSASDLGWHKSWMTEIGFFGSPRGCGEIRFSASTQAIPDFSFYFKVKSSFTLLGGKKSHMQRKWVW